MEQTSALGALSREAKDELIHRLFQGQNSLCYICSKVINLQVQEADIDHITALTNEGPDNESNWGLAHSTCNRSKGARDLRLQRILYEFASHVDKHTGLSDTATGRFTLYEAMQELSPTRQEIGCRIDGDHIEISWNDDGRPVTERHPMLIEENQPLAQSFVAMLPFTCLHHDRDAHARRGRDCVPNPQRSKSGGIDHKV